VIPATLGKLDKLDMPTARRREDHRRFAVRLRIDVVTNCDAYWRQTMRAQTLLWQLGPFLPVFTSLSGKLYHERKG
jgi:hypothetical protein